MNVLFFAHDPGGANAIAPIIEHFENPWVFGGGYALNILPGVSKLPPNALEILKPDFLLTGTSALDFTERELWKEAASLSIPSMAILDSWVNYGVRFSRYGVRDVSLFDGACEYLPDYICVMDEFAKSEMMNDGVPGDRIVTLGNPHFESVAKAAKQQLSNIEKTRGGKRFVLFASEPFYGHKTGVEETALRDLIEVVKPYENYMVRIRKHPKESQEKFDKFLGLRVEIDDNIDSLTSISQSEVIVSVSSMVLLEALFFGKMVISYQPKTYGGRNDFFLTRNNTLPFIQTFNELSDVFGNMMKGNAEKPDLKIPSEGVINRIAQFIKEHKNG